MTDRFREIRERLLELAQTNTDIAAIIEIGSQTRKNQPAYQFSDLDVILAAQEPSRYLYTEELISRLGDPLISFTEPTLAGGTERRVLFEGSLDVDIVVVTPGQLRAAAESGELAGIFARGSRVLFDRMGISEILCTAPGQEPEKLMSRQEFMNTVNDFWFHTVWAAKKLRRGELYTALTCVNCYLSSLLLRMIELYERNRHTEGYDVWHNGRLLERWAGEDVTAGLEGCFARYDAADAARALRAAAELYARLSRAAASLLGYDYPGKAQGAAEQIFNKMLENS